MRHIVQYSLIANIQPFPVSAKSFMKNLLPLPCFPPITTKPLANLHDELRTAAVFSSNVLSSYWL